MKVKVTDAQGLDKKTIDKIESNMQFNRWHYENDTKFAELENSRGDIIRIFPERIEFNKITIPVCYIPTEDNQVVYDTEYMKYLFERQLEKLNNEN